MTDYEIAERLEQAITAKVCQDEYLEHHGIPNMKWGVRRWQNEDGSLTPEGRIHYGYGKDGKQTPEGRVLEEYTQLEWDRMNARYDIEEGRLNKKLDKAEAKYYKRPSKGRYRNLEYALGNLYDAKEKRAILKTKIEDIDLDEIKKENQLKGKAVLKSCIGTVGGVVLGIATGTYVVMQPNLDKTVENYRLGGKQNVKAIREASRQKAREELKKR